MTIAAAFALYFCKLALDDLLRVAHTAATCVAILSMGAGVVACSVVFGWIRRCRLTYYFGLAASALLFIFSMVCLCI
jgi:hypothetical protein